MRRRSRWKRISGIEGVLDDPAPSWTVVENTPAGIELRFYGWVRPARQRPRQGAQRIDPHGQGRLRARRHRVAAHRVPRPDVARTRTPAAAVPKPARAHARQRPSIPRSIATSTTSSPTRNAPTAPGTCSNPETTKHDARSQRDLPAVLSACRWPVRPSSRSRNTASGKASTPAPRSRSMPIASPATTGRPDDTRATPTQADAAAAIAKQNRKAASAAEAAGTSRGDRALRATSDLFASEPEDAIANAGKGSLLDSRWELAKDSKLGTFNFRAYKPVYLLPVFWSSNQNTMPQSPNPRQHRHHAAEPGQHRDQVPDQLQDQGLGEPVRRQRRHLDGLYPELALAGLQRRGIAPVPRDQLRTRSAAGVPQQLQLRRLEGPHGRGRHQPPVQRPRRSVLAQLEPGDVQRRPRPRELGGDVPSLDPHFRRQRRRQPGHRGLHGPRRHDPGAHAWASTSSR